MRKHLAIAVVVVLVAALAGTALAGKKRKPNSYKSEDVEISVGHTATLEPPEVILSVTAQEFIRTCALPSSNGLDAYVFEVPAPYRRIGALITAHGQGGSPYAPDPDIFLFTESCQLTEYFIEVGPDEIGAMRKGTAFILINNGSIIGGPMSAWFELAPR